MHMFDASSTIYGWDNYPLAQFPGLWDWLGSQIDSDLVTLSETAHREVYLKTPDCGQWLKDNGLTIVANTPATLQEAPQIKSLLNIVGDDYGGGVGENDLLIIASAKIEGATLVSDEKKQQILPADHKKFKIPAVCAYLNSAVPCENFLEYIVSSGQSF
jgi:hypothetical protein